MLNLFFVVSFGALVLAGLGFWYVAWTRYTRGVSVVDPLGVRDPVGSPFGFVDVLLVFFAWVGGQIIALSIAQSLLEIDQPESSAIAGNVQPLLMGLVAGGQLLATLLAFGFLGMRYGRRLDALSIYPKFLRRDLVLGVVAFVMVIPVILLVQWALTWLVDYEHASLEMLNKDAGVFTFAVVWFSAGLVAPVCEEIFFRGVVQAWLQRLGTGRWYSDQVIFGGWDKEPTSGLLSTASGLIEDSKAGRGSGQTPSERLPIEGNVTRSTSCSDKRSWVSESHWPIFATALFFALLHVGQGAAPVPLFMFAVVLGYLFRKSGSILPCIVLHMLLNVFSLFWFTLNIFWGGTQLETDDAVVGMSTIVEFGSELARLF